MMSIKTPLLERRFIPSERIIWWQWLVGNILGFFATYAILLVGAYMVDSRAIYSMFAFLAGCSLGFLQWFMIKKWIDIDRWWIFATGIGFTMIAIFRYEINWNCDDILSALLRLLIEGIIFGVIIGLLQYSILRHHIQKPTLWVWANIVGWSIAPFLGLFLFPFLGGPPYGLIGAIIATMITGWAMGKLLRTYPKGMPYNHL